MADRIVNVLTPATEFDLITLTEAKMMMGLPLTDTSSDAQIQMWIDINSQMVATLCNRVFAREEVREEWRDMGGAHRIYLTRWPVAAADLETIENPVGVPLDPSMYELEEDSGKLEIFTANSWSEPLVITYWGGYILPDDVPLPLKQAVTLLNVQSKLLASLGLLAGIRLLSHKEKRVGFHDPMKILEAAMGGMGSSTGNAVMSILDKYIRLEV